ncbi:hypothetical protein LOC67_03280 [Stieleria sp. JC731]|uniref:hypothetical protein n=1 Tax=Pirellulaceae TaxID=2691357 RepID=UPI001E446C63|nr:hypothetical protein [Stieleria sp. JC731]MCC9599570.1 hypothetical protein [Stieleria sp. JC731]
MRQFRLFKNTAVAALVASSVLAGTQASARQTDFDALLAEVEFGDPSGAPAVPAVPQQAPAVEAGAQSALGLELPAEPLPEIPATAPVAETAAPVEASALTNVPAPIPAPAPIVDSVAAEPCQSCGDNYASACGCNNGCNGGCKLGNKLSNRFQEGSCMPYMPPQMPTSTFYQYWRSNACNTNVWDGYRNRCNGKIDMSIHRDKAHGCDTCSGAMPANWCDLQQSCD